MVTDDLAEAFGKIAWYRQRKGEVAAACLRWWVDEFYELTGGRAACLITNGESSLLMRWWQ